MSNYFKNNKLWNLKCQRHASSVMYPSHSPTLQIGFGPGETKLNSLIIDSSITSGEKKIP